MKLAILSGTFNPIHKAHISIAEYVRRQFAKDKILLIPAYNPPFKSDCAPASARLEMVKLAASNYPELEVSNIEYENESKSYSYLTVKKLYERYPIEGKISFIIGTDAYVGLGSWYETDKLKEIVEFIVFERGISFDDKRVKELQETGYNLLRADLPFKDISSSEIRTCVKNGKSISSFVEKTVEDYIYEHGLYK